MNKRMYKSYCGKIDKYIEYLNNHDKNNYSINKKKNEKTGYTDPDGTYGGNSEFYKKIEYFLNNKKIDGFHDNWKYVFHKGTGIDVINKKTSEYIFTLRSDQFGFSAIFANKRSWTNRYPYARYINNSKKKNKRVIVADTIWGTRTLGGSFLWPITCTYNVKNKTIEKRSLYNIRRGICSYIEDRVDLTLFEIKQFYYLSNKKFSKLSKRKKYKEIKDYMNRNNFILLQENKKEIIGDDSFKIFIWLNHFKTFENFANFFDFNSFLSSNYDVINLLNGTPLKMTYVENALANKEPIIANENTNNLLKIFIRLKKQTLMRTERIENLFNDKTNK